MGDTSSDAGGVQLAKTTKTVLSYPEIEKLARAFVASGMFGRDMDKISKGITKIMAGQELGLAPFASMRAVYVIEGNATLSANTMAGMVKSSGRYDYEVLKKEKDVCEIAFFEVRNGKRIKLGVESFDEEEAKAAGLLHKNNWKNYPKAMMFARCISNGVRTYCPDVFSGMVVYTPDELDGQVNASGDFIEGEVVEEKPAAKQEDPSDKDIDQRPEEEKAEEAEASEDSADIEDPVEEETPIEITEALKNTLADNIESFNLTSQAKMRLIKDETGSVTLAQIKEDEQWRALHKRVASILMGEEELPIKWIKQEVEEQDRTQSSTTEVETEPEQEKLV